MPGSVTPELVELTIAPGVHVEVGTGDVTDKVARTAVDPTHVLPGGVVDAAGAVVTPSVELYAAMRVFQFADSRQFECNSVLAPSNGDFYVFSAHFSDSYIAALTLTPFGVVTVPPARSPFPSLIVTPGHLNTPGQAVPASLVYAKVPLQLTAAVYSVSLIQLVVPSRQVWWTFLTFSV